MEIKPEWETLINQKHEPSTTRMKVIGGWIVRTADAVWSEGTDQSTISEATVFVPDQNHEWEITT
jgi:hypothetical protein